MNQLYDGQKDLWKEGNVAKIHSPSADKLLD